jgi:hypothetical protein
MTTRPVSKKKPHRPARRKSASTRRSSPAAAIKRSAKKQVDSAAPAAMKKFASLLRRLKSKVHTLSDAQKVLLKKALKHAHKALD